mgnify:CR=1 FL=1
MGIIKIFQRIQSEQPRLPVWKAVVRIYARLALLLISAVSTAGEIQELSVSATHGEYNVRLVAILDAPEQHVYDVITDYANAYRINPGITSVDILPSGKDGVVRVQHRSNHRLGPFSLEVDWAGDIVETGDGHIHITTVPEFSSFHSGFARWEIQAQGNRTHVLHESSLRPAFDIFPIIGTYIVKKHIKEETLTTFSRIERYAQITLARESGGRPEQLEALLQQLEGSIDSLVYEEILTARTH